MAAIKIRVGASLDRSVDVVFASIEKRAKRTGDVVAASLSKRGGRGGPYREYQREGEAAHRRVTTAAQKAAREQERAVSASLRKQAQAFKQFANIAGREMARAHRQQERDGRNRRETFARRTSYGAMRGGRVVGGFAARATHDMLRGAGVDFNLGAGVGRSIDMQKTATRLSNAAFLPGASGAAGVRQSPEALANEARGIADRLQGTTTPGAVLAGQEAFVAKTGDLETARAVTEDLAKLSAAYGSNLEDVVDAAGDVSSVLGDVPDKAGKVGSIMKTVAAQGKLGAVEMKDLATQMAKIASAAVSFEGDTGENIKKLSALTQFARARGGAASATQAATATAGFANTLKTPARVAAFKKEGIDVMNARGQLRDPMKLIEEALTVAGDDPTRLKKMFASVVGGKGVEALANTYRQAGGGDAGLTAVRKEWDQFLTKATVSDKELADSLKAVQNTDAAKAQKFQNELDKVVTSLAGKVLPELEKLAPVALQLTQSLSKAVAWAAENPGKAITAAIVASIGQAAIGAGIRAAIEGMIRGSGGGAAGAAGKALSGGGMGTAVPLVGATVAAVVGTDMATDQASKLKAETGSKANLSDILPGYNDGKFSYDTLLEDTINPLSRIKRSALTLGQAGSDVANFDKNMNAQAKAAAALREEGGGGAEVERAVTGLGSKLDALNNKLGGTLSVRVEGRLTVPQTGRQPNGGVLP